MRLPSILLAHLAFVASSLNLKWLQSCTTYYCQQEIQSC